MERRASARRLVIPLAVTCGAAAALGRRGSVTSSQLINGFTEATHGFSEAINGFAEANNGFAEANNGFAEANNGFAEAINGFTEANDGFAEANDGFVEANDGFAEANDGFAEANDGFTEAINGFAEAINGFGEAIDGCNTTNLYSSQAEFCCIIPSERFVEEKGMLAMSTIERGVSTAPAPGYAQTAQNRLDDLRRWREQIPHFVIPPAADATQRMSAVAAIPPEFIELTNVAVANQTSLVRLDGATPAHVRDLMAYADAYAPLVGELQALAQFLDHSVTAARNQAATEALTTYALAQRLAKLPATAHLAPHVADMRRALGRTRKRTPEELAQRAVERAAKAAAKVAKKALKALPAAEGETTEEEA